MSTQDFQYVIVDGKKFPKLYIEITNKINNLPKYEDLADEDKPISYGVYIEESDEIRFEITENYYHFLEKHLEIKETFFGTTRIEKVIDGNNIKYYCYEENEEEDEEEEEEVWILEEFKDAKGCKCAKITDEIYNKLSEWLKITAIPGYTKRPITLWKTNNDNFIRWNP
jgi:hypothetical protein